jgi:hypothetical protein
MATTEEMSEQVMDIVMAGSIFSEADREQMRANIQAYLDKHTTKAKEAARAEKEKGNKK